MSDPSLLETKALDRFVIKLLIKGQAHADSKKNVVVEPVHLALAVLQSDAGAALTRARGLDVDALCKRTETACNALPGKSAEASYLSPRTIELLAGTARLATACDMRLADLSIFMRVLASHGHLPKELARPWSEEERAIVMPLIESPKAMVKPSPRFWGPEHTVRELRRELECRFTNRSVGSIECERFLLAIGDHLPGFDATSSVGRVNLERDGRTLTVEWNDDADEVVLSVKTTEPSKHERREAFSWSLELKTFMTTGGRELLVAFREAVMELTVPVM